MIALVQEISVAHSTSLLLLLPSGDYEDNSVDYGTIPANDAVCATVVRVLLT